MNLYEVLGVTQMASKYHIKAAYRSKAQRCHPDKGGDPEEFHIIQLAYDVLSDPVKRQRYDETGETETVKEPDPIEQQLLQLFVNLITKGDLSTNIVIKGNKRKCKHSYGNNRSYYYSDHSVSQNIPVN